MMSLTLKRHASDHRHRIFLMVRINRNDNAQPANLVVMDANSGRELPARARSFGPQPPQPGFLDDSKDDTT